MTTTATAGASLWPNSSTAGRTYCFERGAFDADDFDVSTFIHMQSLTSSLDKEDSVE